MYTEIVKNITLSAEEALIQRARLKAANQKTTLNAAFREWLERYAGSETSSQEYAQLMKQLSHARSRGPYSRDKMNER